MILDIDPWVSLPGCFVDTMTTAFLSSLTTVLVHKQLWGFVAVLGLIHLPKAEVIT
jgi:hypothetical protein